MHDILPGTSIPSAYALSWNDEIIALNQFADVAQSGVQSVANSLNTQTVGVPLLVYNPLAFSRTDVVTAEVVFPGAVPQNIAVYGPDKKQIPTQVLTRNANRATLLFLATVPPVGCAVFEARAAKSPPAASSANAALRVSQSGLENARYQIALNENGDIDANSG